MATSITATTKEGRAERSLAEILQVLKLSENPDTLERIQQQLAKMNEDENLEPGERHYE